MNLTFSGVRIDEDVANCDAAVVAMGPWCVLAEAAGLGYTGFRVKGLGFRV